MYQPQCWSSYSLFLKLARGLKEWLQIIVIYPADSV